MGLDNSIVVKRNEYSNKIKELKRFTMDFDKDEKYSYEICYWRKCWNIRHRIMDEIDHIYDGRNSEIYKDDIEKIIQILKSFNKNNWTNDGNSIWEWDEYKKHIKCNIKDLKRLKRLMRKYELQVMFIDSY